MTNTRAAALVLVAMAAVVASGCGGAGSATSQATAPSTVASSGGSNALGGTWTSSSTAAPLSADACRDITWTITNVTPTSGSGTFSATCPGGVKVSGTGTGTLTGATLEWRANGSATDAAGRPCAFELYGAGTLQPGGVRITYAGTVCGTVVNGSDLWQRR